MFLGTVMRMAGKLDGIAGKTTAALVALLVMATAADGRRNREGYSCAHPTDSHAPHQTGIPNGIQLSEFIH